MLALLWGLAVAAATKGDPEIMNIRVYPPVPLIEATRHGQALNFDFELENKASTELELTAAKLVVRDGLGRVVQRLEINNTGNSPAIETLPHRTWAQGEARIIFNPFHTLSSDVALRRMDYTFTFKDRDDRLHQQSYSVIPAIHTQRTRLVLPMRGRIWIYDGHDYTSHHRRLDFDSPGMKKYGRVTGNASRYAFDFVVVDEEGNAYRGTGERPEDYYSYGYPVIAPAGGTVVRAVGSASDFPTPLAREGGLKADVIAKDPFAEAGNYIVIDHGNGEFSQFGHFKNGSVRVKAGDKVVAGQVIALAGRSGSSLFPHLHYQLTAGPNVDSEGLPVVFENVRRITGGRVANQSHASIDSGDIVVSGEPARR